MVRKIVFGLAGAFCLLLTGDRSPAAEPRKFKIVFIKYNLLKDNRELSVVRNNPIVSGEMNHVVVTLFNTGAEDYEGITVRPFSRDRYLNVKLSDRTKNSITIPSFRAGDVRQLENDPIIITVAPTCPDEYRGNIYLLIKGDGYKKTIRQFVVEVSNPGILKSSPDRFDELYGGLGVKTETPVKTKKGKSRRRKGRGSSAINSTIQKYQMEVYYCYQQQLRRYPNLKGEVIIKFTIRPYGNVINIRVIKSTINNKDVEGCLVRRIKTWKFRTIPKSYGNLSITYPFGFDNK